MTSIIQPWLQPLIRPMRSVFREVFLLSLFINALALAVPVFIQQVYDRVVAHAGLSTLHGLVIGMALLLVFDYVLRQARARVLQTVALRIDIDVGELVFDKFMALPLRTLESRPSAAWQLLFRDIDTIRNTLSGATALLALDLPFIVLFLALIFVIAEPIAWVFVCVLPFFMALAWRSGTTLNEASVTEKSRQGNRDTLLAEMIASRTTIKSLALERSVRPLWDERQANTIEMSILRGARADGYVNLATLFTLGTNVMMTSVGAVFIIEQKLTMGALIACNMLVARLLSPLNQLVGAWRGMSAFRQSMSRIGALLAEEEERQVPTLQMDRPKGALTLADLRFTYDERLPPIIDNISLVIPAGGITAILGRNGTGKTTLLKLMQWLYKPQNGRVLLDGGDLNQFSRHEIARWMGYVPQECVLLTGTIRDNIAQGTDTPTDEQILTAARQAGVHQFIIDLPNGYSTEIGEAGSRLSAGQRQRIALARALIGDPPILLLDEPSASLDRQAEESLRDTLFALGRDHTIIMVTHSPVLLQACRNVVVLDNARISIAGPASEVLPRLFPARPTVPLTPPSAIMPAAAEGAP